MRSDNKSSESATKVAVRWIIDIVIAVIIAFAITQVIRPTIVRQTSMLPNFIPNDYVFVNRIAYKKALPKKGDVVIFKSDLKTEDGKNKMLIKRVIGLPGDHIEVRNGNVYINGKKDLQSYTNDKETDMRDNNDIKLNKNELFCMGDNRLGSEDSRDADVGVVKKDRLVGKAVFKVYHFDDFGPVENPYKN